jgi:hypothetical protein
MVMDMAYYAFLDTNNVVTEVIPGKDENDGGIDWEQYYGDFRGQICKRTSYNTHGGIHINGGVPFRKNYAGIGYTFDSGRDAFIQPKPFASWVLDEDTCQWKAPVDMPTDGGMYSWDEATQAWVNGN